jgi:hypothetical protein
MSSFYAVSSRGPNPRSYLREECYRRWKFPLIGYQSETVLSTARVPSGSTSLDK